jgi:hypothetical protein
MPADRAGRLLDIAAEFEMALADGHASSSQVRQPWFSHEFFVI